MVIHTDQGVCDDGVPEDPTPPNQQFRLQGYLIEVVGWEELVLKCR